MMEGSISISICVPAFNEEKTLKAAVEDLILTLTACVRDLEIIIVNDGSNDLTPQLANQLAKERYQVKVIHHKKNSGIASCYRDALAIAEGEYFTWFPADHENRADEFVRCLAYLGKNTVVTCHHQSFDQRSLLRRIISRSYVWILNKYFHLNLTYYNGLSIFPTSVLRSVPLTADGFFLFAESIIRAIKQGCKVVELLAPLRKRNFGKSKAFSLLSLKQMIKDMHRAFFKKSIK